MLRLILIFLFVFGNGSFVSALSSDNSTGSEKSPEPETSSEKSDDADKDSISKELSKKNTVDILILSEYISNEFF